MKKLLTILLICILLIPITTKAVVKDLICTYYYSGENILYFQQADYPYKGFRTTGTIMDKADILDRRWNHGIEYFTDYEYYDVTFDESGHEWFAECPKFMGYESIGEDRYAVIFFNNASTYDDDNNQYTPPVTLNYSLNQQINKAWNDVLVEVEQAKQQPQDDPEHPHGDSPVLSCYYEHDSDVVILAQDKNGNLSAKIGEFGNGGKSCLKSAYSEVTDSDAIFDLDKSDKVKKTDWGTLQECPDNIAVYNQSVYHIELGLGVMQKQNKTGNYDVCPPPGKGMDDSGLGIDREKMSCTRILGKTLSKVVKGGIIVIQIVAGIVALLKGMMVLIPPLVAKDAEALKKASGTLVKMGIILVLVLIFRPFARLLGTILDFDVSCIL